LSNAHLSKRFGIYPKLFLVLTFALGLTACGPRLQDGSYQGVLFRQADTAAIAAGKSLRENVTIDVTFTQSKQIHLEMKNFQHETVDTAEVSWKYFQRKVSVQIPSLDSQTYELRAIKSSRKDHSWKCYQGTQKYVVSACFSSKDFVFSAIKSIGQEMVYSISGTFGPSQVAPQAVTSRVFTLTEAVEKSLSQGFDARIEYQRVLEAREAARVAYANLFPHFTVANLVSFVGILSPVSMITFIAEFFPFVIPNRWIKIEEAKTLSYAETLTQDILRADLAYQVQSLAYTMERDHQNLDFYQRFLRDWQCAYDHLVKVGGVDAETPGSSAHDLLFRTHNVFSFAKLEVKRLETAIFTDKTELSMSLGFENSLAVSDINIEEDPNSITHANEFNADQKAKIVLMIQQRPLELVQLNYLIENAGWMRERYYFNWADPDMAQADQSISLSLSPLLAKASAFINQLKTKLDQTKGDISRKAENTVFTYNNSLQSYQIVMVEISHFEEKISRIHSDIMKATTIDELNRVAADMSWVLIQYFQYRLKMNDTVSNFRISRAMLQRLLYQAYYSRHQTGTLGRVSELML
jgi:hypothetical protein